MNTYLIPYEEKQDVDIFRVVAPSWEDCLQKVMDKYIDRFYDDDDIASIDDFDDFCDYLADKYSINIGIIHELEDFA